MLADFIKPPFDAETNSRPCSQTEILTAWPRTLEEYELVSSGVAVHRAWC